MNVWDAIKQRKSIRVFNPTPLPRQLIEKVLIGLILKYQNIIKDSLRIAPDKRLVVGVCLGYPDPTDPINRFQPEKVGLDQVVKWIGFT